jgi:hypothetical protein
LAERTAENVAPARTSVPPAVAKDEIVTQSGTECDRSSTAGSFEPGGAGMTFVDLNRGGVMDEQTPSEKGEWAATAEEGVVPDELGGSDAPGEPLPDDPELGSSVLGRTAESDEPATDGGVDLSAGDNADAVADGGPDVPDDVEPDLKDATPGPRQVDVDSAG